MNEQLDEFSISIELTVKEVNALLNILNTPIQVPATTLAAFINQIQQQAIPQVEKAKAALEAIKGVKDEPKAAT